MNKNTSKETATMIAESKGYKVSKEITLDDGTHEFMVGDVRVYYHKSFGGRACWKITGDDRHNYVGEMILQAVNNQELAKAETSIEAKRLSKLRRAEKLKAERAARLTPFHQELLEALGKLGDGTVAMAIAIFLDTSVFMVSGGMSSLVEKGLVRSKKDSKGKAHYIYLRD